MADTIRPPQGERPSLERKRKVDYGGCRGRPTRRRNGEEGLRFYFCSDDDARWLWKKCILPLTQWIIAHPINKRNGLKPNPINLTPRIRTPLKRLPEARRHIPPSDFLLSFSSSSSSSLYSLPLHDSFLDWMIRFIMFRAFLAWSHLL